MTLFFECYLKKMMILLAMLVAAAVALKNYYYFVVILMVLLLALESIQYLFDELDLYAIKYLMNVVNVVAFAVVDYVVAVDVVDAIRSLSMVQVLGDDVHEAMI